MLERNRRYYERFPEDRERVRALLDALDAEDVRLPTGDRLTAAPLAPARQPLGMSDGAESAALPARAAARLARVPPRRRRRARFARNPLYAVAARGLLGRRRRDPLVGASGCCPATSTTSPSCFTGEHVFPWMFEDYGALRAAARGRRRSPSTSGRGCTTPSAARQRGPGRRRDLRRGPLRRARVLGADGRAGPRCARG